jgi:serine acetyltransferase
VRVKSTSAREAWRADMAANASSAKGRLVMSLFRLGQSLGPVPRRLYQPIYYVLVDIVMGISLPIQTNVAPGFGLRHGQGVVVSWKSVIGPACELHQNVTLGESRGGAPNLGSGVVVGANAVIIGNVHVGDGARVGAGAVVLDDVAPGSTVISPKARPLPPRIL